VEDHTLQLLVLEIIEIGVPGREGEPVPFARIGRAAEEPATTGCG
jgi:hypothetical protein